MADEIYPRVVKSSDPMLVRFDELSLLVNSTTFSAKIKVGIQFKGFLIYVSGCGTPCYQKQFTDSQIGYTSYGASLASDEGRTRAWVTEQAKLWIDNLQDALNTEASSTDVSTSINRLCMQLHYDLTHSKAGYPDRFEEDTITIDETAKSLIPTLYSTTGSGSSITVSSECLAYYVDKTAKNIKADDDTYTISQALRENGYDSVSKEIRNEAGKIEAGLGQNGVINTSLTSINSSLGPSGSINSSLGTVNDSIGGVSNKLGAASSSETGNNVIGGLNKIRWAVGGDVVGWDPLHMIVRNTDINVETLAGTVQNNLVYTYVQNP